MRLNEWGLGGRGFGIFVSWFLLGGDIYTAYTFIAVPALVYATGAAGFYALSYTIMVFPIVFIFAPRLWSVARARGYVSPGEFVRGRHASQGLGLAVAATGILATMPYIALQLVGIESVLTVMGIGTTSSNAFVRDLPLIIAFAVVSAYTYLAGLRAPALIAFVKDILIYVTVIVAIAYFPGRLGGWGHILDVASAHLKTVNPATGKHRADAGRRVGLRYPRARLGAGPVRVPARGHRCIGALGFALALNKTFSINLQLLGGIWILQTFPAVVVGLYTRWFHRFALIIGWAVGMAYGTVQAYRMPGGGQAHFGSSAAPVFGHVTYIAITALILNLAAAAVLTPVFRKIGLQDGYDETRRADYVADPVPVPVPTAPAGTGTPGRSADPVTNNRVVFMPGTGPPPNVQVPASTSAQAKHRRP